MEISEAAVLANIASVRRLVDPATVLMGVVKADAYGHGLVSFSRLLVRHGVEQLAVAHAEEAFRLRDAGIDAPVLVLNHAPTADLPGLLRAGIRQAVYGEAQARAVSRAARALGCPARIHVKVDTGLSRFGFSSGNLAPLARIAALDNVVVEGFHTHLASAEEDVADRQLSLFDDACRRATGLLGYRPTRHALASAAIAAGLHGRAPLEMVRPGILLCGLPPSYTASDVPGDAGRFQPVLSMTSRIEQIRSVAAGTRIGYGAAHVTSAPATIAIVPVGFADGLPRALADSGRVIVARRYAPIVGPVGMGHLTLDVTGIPGVSTGDEVVLLGSDGHRRLGIQDWAAAAGTINTDVLVRLASAAPRVVRPLSEVIEQECYV
ncbi:alanine racemase [Streptomyces albiflavescens]|nr:alanine racemase [Streptomyces albiflavescens]